MLSANKRISIFFVDLTGVEPVISAMRMRRITNCATGPTATDYIKKEPMVS